MPVSPSVRPLPGPRAYFPGQLRFAFRADPLGFLTRNAQKYGDFFAIPWGKIRLLVASHPDVIREVLVGKADRFTKSPALRQARAILGDGLLTSEGDFHRRQRRLSQPAFHPQRVATYAAPMARQAQRTSDGWANDAVVDLHTEMMKLTLRVVTETLFGESIDSQVDEIGQAMDVLVKMFDRARNPLAPLLNRLPLPSNYRFLRARAQVLATIERFIAQNRQSGVDRGDLLSTLIRATDTEDSEGTPGMSDMQLSDELVTLFAAGHETTANALTFAWRLVALHPNVATRLYEEVDRELPTPTSTEELAGSAADRLPYTRAVIAEAMRLFPPAWVLMRQAKETLMLGSADQLVRKDDIIVTSQWVVHHDKRWWPDAETFNPDRWFDEPAKEARPKYAYFPFGGGPRSCIGEAFAWTEAVLLLAVLARNWRLELMNQSPMKLLPTITLRPKHELLVRLKKR